MQPHRWRNVQNSYPIFIFLNSYREIIMKVPPSIWMSKLLEIQFDRNLYKLCKNSDPSQSSINLSRNFGENLNLYKLRSTWNFNNFEYNLTRGWIYKISIIPAMFWRIVPTIWLCRDGSCDTTNGSVDRKKIWGGDDGQKHIRMTIKENIKKITVR